jgi:hypothetical protein
MPVEDAIKTLSAMLRVNPSANVLIAADPDDDLVLQRLTVTDALAREFLATARTACENMDKMEFLPYDPGYKPETDQRFYIELEDYPDILETVNQLAQILQAELFSEDEEVLDTLRFYAIIVSTQNDSEAIFIREYTPKRELSRKGGFAAFFHDGTYNRVESKVFLFDSATDCFVWNGYLVINNIAAFQRIFDFFSAVRAKADETLDVILEKVPVANAADFRDACKGQIQMVAKLIQISRKDYLQGVTMDKIESTIDEFDLDIKICEQNGQKQLVFEPAPNKRWIILKLLDDGYLGSTMTQMKYEVNSKSAMS